MFLAALQQTLQDYANGLFYPLCEADIQAHLYTWCVFGLRDRMDTLPVHVENKIFPAPPGWSNRQRIDLVLGDEVAVELKFEPLLPSRSGAVAESREALDNIERLKQLRKLGFQYCHLIFIDEHGMHARSRLYDGIGAAWSSLQTRKGPAHFLHWTPGE